MFLHAAASASRSPAPAASRFPRLGLALLVTVLCSVVGTASAWAQGSESAGGGEANLVVPPLADTGVARFLGDTSGHTLLLVGLLVCALGIAFGLFAFTQLRNAPVHASMREMSELIYATCKTYLTQQLRFIGLLWVFIGAIMVLYFGVFQHYFAEGRGFQVLIILFFSIVGIAGSTAVAWFGIRVNTFANSRTAFAALRGKPYPCYAIPLQAGIGVGRVLLSIELLIMLLILLFIPREYAGPCFIGCAIGESLSAAALRIAGGIFTKIADIGSDLMKIVFGIKED